MPLQHTRLLPQKEMKSGISVHLEWSLLKAGFSLQLLQILPRARDGGNASLKLNVHSKYRGAPHEFAANDKTSSITLVDEDVYLHKTHAYFYHLQLQMFFVFCNSYYIHVERIVRDAEFSCATVSRAEEYSTPAVLPELVSRWFTSKDKTIRGGDTRRERWCWKKYATGAWSRTEVLYMQ